MVKVLQYTHLKEMGDAQVYSLTLPNFFEDLVERGDTLEEILVRLTYDASYLRTAPYPQAVATKEEWLEYMQKWHEEIIQDATSTLEALKKLN